MSMFLESMGDMLTQSGFAAFFQDGGWKNLIMIAIACVLMYLAIVKQYEPLLLLPIAFGMLLVNIPLGGVMDYPKMIFDLSLQWMLPSISR